MPRAKRKKPHNPAGRMTGDRRICRAMRKSQPSRSTIRWRWSRERRSSRCARSATIRSAACIRIVRSTRRSIRAGGRSRTIGRRPSAVRARSIRPGNMSMAGRCAEPITEGQRKAVLRLNRAERELGADGSALVHDVLVHGLTMEQVGQRRGLAHPALERLFRAAIPRMPRSAGADLRVCVTASDSGQEPCSAAS